MKDKKVLHITKKIEQLVISVLLLALFVVVIYAGIIFLTLLFSRLIASEHNAVSALNFLQQRHNIYDGFLMILVGIGLIHMTKSYLDKEVFSVEIIMAICLIGLSRHMIYLKYKEIDTLTIIGMGAIILALGVGYLIIKKGLDLE